MSDEVVTEKVRKRVRSPELERLIRALEMVASDLPRILRKEKEVAFSNLVSVDLFEAHLKEMQQMPAHLEALSRVVDRSLQVNGGAAHLSRLFRALHNARVPDPPPEVLPEDPAPAVLAPSETPDPGVDVSERGLEAPAGRPEVSTDPETGDLRSGSGGRAPYHAADLNLDAVRLAIVPGGEVCGRSMFESSRARLVTARASGDGPWRFQFRRGSLKWAAEGEEKGLRGMAAMLCGDIGYVTVPASVLLETVADHMTLSSGGNAVCRPSVAIFGGEAILHPGSMSKTRPGEAMKLAFVEF